MSNPETDVIPSDAPVPAPVLLTVKAEHVATPHSFLFRLVDMIVIDARIQDLGDSDVAPDTTIETILLDAGVDPPIGDEEVVVSFSPQDASVVAVTPRWTIKTAKA